MSESAWPILRERLSRHLAPEDFALWIEPLAPVGREGGRLRLACPNSFHRRWLREHHLPLMQRLARELAPGLTLELVVDPKDQPAPQAASSRPRQLELPRLGDWQPVLNRRYVFERFITGRSNEFAAAAAKAMAGGQRLYTNTLFLVAGTGLGKSHLTQAVGHYVFQHFPGARVAYLTAEDFANQMISALRRKRIEEFKRRFRRECDVLLLEEVQFLAGKEKTQDELGYTLDALMDAGKRVVFTACQPPHRIKGLKSSLTSRFGEGLTVPIDPPDFETRLRILRSLVQEERAQVEGEVLELVAQEVTEDVRRLRSALVSLLARASLTGRPLDLALAEEVLGTLARRRQRLTPHRILEGVAQVYGLEVDTLTGCSRKRKHTRPRSLAMYLCRRHTGASFAEIGRAFHRDHTTVMYGVNQVEARLSHDPRLSQELAFLEQRLGLSGKRN